MYPQTRQMLKKALDEGNLDLVKAIILYDALGWEDAGHPWPGPRWMQGRFNSWSNVGDWLIELAKIKAEVG